MVTSFGSWSKSFVCSAVFSPLVAGAIVLSVGGSTILSDPDPSIGGRLFVCSSVLSSVETPGIRPKVSPDVDSPIVGSTVPSDGD